MERAQKKDVVITILYDNNPLDDIFQNSCGKWGFSCCIFGLDDVIVFDTGADDGLMLRNMKEAGIDPLEIDTVVLSHGHWDHIGGLESLLRANPDVTIYMPASLAEELNEGCVDYGADVIEVTASMEIMEDVHLITGMHGKIDEISMALNTKNGLILVTGCAHAGIDNILEKATDVLDPELLLVALGGYHTMKMDKEEVKNIISKLKRLGLKYVAPCHCTGEEAMKLFRSAFGDNFIKAGSGLELRSEDLK
ncbi:MAG: MBL fold metallo-hydrolase [Deltaproteobacteria bacterium]|uniref:MBL fold metallo-hydrolase n=1 Tax=Candidatus Zymogenus saltonus TaxID=2844893 RepID=A0A9D8KC48_9DELT|nr:MBL fold metallo-hydrolase [Candidatus Zymogenus saltonus]